MNEQRPPPPKKKTCTSYTIRVCPPALVALHKEEGAPKYAEIDGLSDISQDKEFTDRYKKARGPTTRRASQQAPAAKILHSCVMVYEV